MMYGARGHAFDGFAIPPGIPPISLSKILNVQTVLKKRPLICSMMNSLNLRSFSHLVINLLEIAPSGQAGKAAVESAVHFDGVGQNTGVPSFLRFPLCLNMKQQNTKRAKSVTLVILKHANLLREKFP